MVVASGNPPLGSPVGLMRVQGLDPVPMLVDMVLTSPVVSVGGRSMANRLDPVPMLVDTVSTSPVVSAGGRSMVNRLDVVLPSVVVASTSPVSCQVVLRDRVQPPGRREERFRCPPR